MNKTRAAILGAALAAGLVQTAAAQDQEAAATQDQEGMISLLDVAPAVYWGIKRMPKFYGDKNMDRSTVDGPILDRQYLLGSLGGLRDKAAENGFVIDAGVTQVGLGVVSGDGDGAKYPGSADIWAAFDTGRAGLWPGGYFGFHLEGNWGRTPEGTSAFLPLSTDATMPGAAESLSLSEWYFVQGLPGGFSAIVGKLDFGGLADHTFFANDERSQFLYQGLVNNPILGAFLLYTSIGAAVNIEVNDELNLQALAISNNTDASTVGFDDLSLDTMTYAVSALWTPTFGGKPGFYNLLGGMTAKDPVNFEVSERYLLGELVGLVPVADVSENYGMLVTGSQYLTVDKGAKRHDGLPVGMGFFFRAGWTPEDRNLFYEFYSLGIGGMGGPFGRVNDKWGVGWAGSRLSGDFRGDAELLGLDFESYEHGFEAFYNLELTPAVGLSFNLQYIDGPVESVDDPVLLGTRLQFDF